MTRPGNLPKNWLSFFTMWRTLFTVQFNQNEDLLLVKGCLNKYLHFARKIFEMSMLSSLFIIILVCCSFVQSHESCACVAEEENFTINCNQNNALLSALEVLENNGCASDCSSNNCQRNFYLIQSHHDYCSSGEVNNKILLSFYSLY